MQIIGTLLILSAIAGLLFDSPFDWFNGDNGEEKKEMGWFLYTLAKIYAWGAIFIILLVIFAIIKILWRIA